MSTRRATRRTPAPASAEVEVTQEAVTVETRSTRTRAPRKTAPAPSKTSRAATGKGKGKDTAAAAPTTAAATETETPATKVKAATTTITTTTTTATATSSRATRPDAVASTPGPSTTGKRRLRSTAEADSPLRTLDDQPPPSKRKRTDYGKAQIPAAAPAPERSTPEVEEEEERSDDEETPVFFTKKFEPTAREIQLSEQRDRIASLEETLVSVRGDCAHLRNERDEARAEVDKTLAELRKARAERNDARSETDPTRAELDEARAKIEKLLDELHNARYELDEARVDISRLCGRILEVELNKYETPRKNDDDSTVHQTNAPIPEFDSFDVDESESAKAAFMTGDESAHALLRHVQEAARGPLSTSQSSHRVELRPSTSPVKSAAASPERPFTPSKSIFGSFVASPFTAIKNLFGASTSTPTPPTPTPSRRPPQDSMTEVLTMPPTPVGERPRRSNHKPQKRSRLVKSLLRGIEPEDAKKAAAWAEQVAFELQKDRGLGDKRKRIQAKVLFRDLKHFPSSKPWESGFSFPEDVLDLEDDDEVPAWAVYTSMVEELQHMPKRSKTAHATCEDDDLPASLNQLFATPTPSLFSTPIPPKPKPHSGSEPLHPRRSIDPSPMFDAPLHHQEGVNVFEELRGHDTAASDRENLQRERIAEARKPANTTTANNAESTPKTHDPSHGSFSVPDSDSEEEEDQAQPVWTQPPPPTPTPAHTSLPNANNNDEVEKQRQKLMKHTPHKPSRLQQVSYPSPSLMSDAGESPLRNLPAESPQKVSAQLFVDIPDVEPVDFSDIPEVAAAMASPSYRLRVQEQLQKWAHWSPPVMSYESEEEEISPV